MRTISSTALEAVLAQETETIFLTLLEVDHPSLNEPFRFVDNTESVTYGGDTYVASAFTFQLPDETEGNVPRGRVSIDNIDQQIIAAVRPLKTAPEITVVVGTLNEGSMSITKELGPINFKLKQFEYDALVINGELGFDEDILNQAYPYETFNPRTARGIF